MYDMLYSLDLTHYVLVFNISDLSFDYPALHLIVHLTKYKVTKHLYSHEIIIFLMN